MMSDQFNVDDDVSHHSLDDVKEEAQPLSMNQLADDRAIPLYFRSGCPTCSQNTFVYF